MSGLFLAASIVHAQEELPQQEETQRVCTVTLHSVDVSAAADAAEAEGQEGEQTYDRPAPRSRGEALDAIKVGSEPVLVWAELSVSPGELETVGVPQESGLAVLTLEPTEQQEHGVIVKLDASNARVGSWPLTFKVADGECTGTLEVEQE